jgi:hypothetical protein
MTEAPEKGGLIRHALGSGLKGLIPGQNQKDAIANWRSTTWHGSKGCGEVTKAGIAWYSDAEAWRAGKPGLIVPWRDAIAVIERGCVDGNRERYDAAWKAFVKHSSTPLPKPWIPAYLLEARRAINALVLRVRSQPTALGQNQSSKARAEGRGRRRTIAGQVPVRQDVSRGMGRFPRRRDGSRAGPRRGPPRCRAV